MDQIPRIDWWKLLKLMWAAYRPFEHELDWH